MYTLALFNALQCSVCAYDYVYIKIQKILKILILINIQIWRSFRKHRNGVYKFNSFSRPKK